MLKIDGFDDCIIGECSCWNGNEKVDRYVYNGPGIVASFISDGMTAEEALEYVDYNIEGAYVGPDTPIIMWPIND